MILLQVPDGVLDTITEQLPNANPTTMVGYSLLVIGLCIAVYLLAKENKRLRVYQSKVDAKDLEFKQEFVSILTTVQLHISQNLDLRESNKDLLRDMANSITNVSTNVKETIELLRKLKT